jgi:galactosylceramidase
MKCFTAWHPANLSTSGCGLRYPKAEKVLAIFCLALNTSAFAQHSGQQTTITIDGSTAGKRFDGIGVVDGGGATSVLLKDYPDPQRSQILDLLYKPKFGASVGALLVEIPGDGNSTQGSMPSHMHSRDDLNYHRGYTWWILQQAKQRNPSLTLTGMAWSAPGWLGNGLFWSSDTASYYIKWLSGLRHVYGLEFDALGMRNEKGVDFEFAKTMRASLNANGFSKVKVQGFDNWTSTKLDFVQEMLSDPSKRNAIDILSAHTLVSTPATGGNKIMEWAKALNKPLWNSEEHIYKSGFDCEISIVQGFNLNYIRYGTSLVVNWYGIAGVYPEEPYSELPSALLARSPWSGNYSVREALWGYAHYGQFTSPGWQYLNNGAGILGGGGSYVSLKSPGEDYSVIIETKGAKSEQQLTLQIGQGLSSKELHVWRSNANEQFVKQPNILPDRGTISLSLDPDSIYSLTTTSGQKKGSFVDVPVAKPFPFPYSETFEEYAAPEAYGYLPRYTADIDDVFEVVDRPDKRGKCLRQVVPIPPISWAPEWQPYTILGDDQWQDYDVSADVDLNAGDSAGVMGHMSDVGSGYGSTPKGYFLQLSDNGLARLIAVRGKKNKSIPVGDAEQQALIRAGKKDDVGGEQVLASANIHGVKPGEWHHLKLRFQGSSITGFVDDKAVVTAKDTSFPKGMIGLMAGGDTKRLSTPYFDNILITGTNGKASEDIGSWTKSTPIYQISKP